MNVSEAVRSRKSIRAFMDKPVDSSIIKTLLQKSSRSAASGGNLQPWKIYILNKNQWMIFLNFNKLGMSQSNLLVKFIPQN